MAIIIRMSEFAPKARRSEPARPARDSVGPSGGGASIHLFLGVQYERHAEPGSPPPPALDIALALAPPTVPRKGRRRA